MNNFFCFYPNWYISLFLLTQNPQETIQRTIATKRKLKNGQLSLPWRKKVPLSKMPPVDKSKVIRVDKGNFAESIVARGEEIQWQEEEKELSWIVDNCAV